MPDGALTGRHILIVEDEYMLASALAGALADAGAKVVGTASSVEQGLALLEGEPDIDAAVLDVNLGGIDVYPVADALVERGVPFLFVTGYDRGVILPRFAQVPRLEKPVPIARITMAIASRFTSLPHISAG